jgi:cell wall-associated NlpC family hydrolase
MTDTAHDDEDDDEGDPEAPEVAEMEAADPSAIPPDEGNAGGEGVFVDVDAIDPVEDAIAEGTTDRSSISGLSAAKRREARHIAVRAAQLALAHAPIVHYTQSPSRWEGIARGLRVDRDQFPKNADCSSFTSWCLWNGLKVRFGIGDTVNGANWTGGFTGTMLEHGKPVTNVARAKLGDLVLYGRVGNTASQHVAIHVGGGMVISHGSEAAPFKLRWNYRSDVIGFRRYI